MPSTKPLRTTTRNYVAVRVFSAWLCCMTTLPLSAQTPLTLQKAIRMALANNVEIRLARDNQKVVHKKYHIGNAGFLPTIDAYLNNYATRPTKPETDPMEQLTWNALRPTKPETDLMAQIVPGVELKWNIFSGLKGVYTYQHLGQLHRIAQLQTQQVIQDQIVAVIKKYYALVLAQQKQRVLEGALAVAQEVLDMAQQQYQLGKGTRLDHLTAQVQYNTEQAQLLAHQEVLQTTRAELQGLLGNNPSQEITAVDHIPAPQQLSRESLSQSLLTTSLQLMLAQQHYQKATTNVKQQYAKLWPQVDLSLGYQGEKCYNHSNWREMSRRLRCGVVVRLNLFNALQDYTNIQVAHIAVSQAQLRLSAQQQQLQATLQQRYLHYTYQLERYDMAQQHTKVSQQNVVLALEQYKLGRITLLTLNKAKQSAQQTELRQLQSAYDAKIAEVELQQLCNLLGAEE